MALGCALQQLLNERGITVKEFAESIGVAPTTLYSFIKRDSSTGKLELINKISMGLGMSISDFLEYGSDKQLINGMTYDTETNENNTYYLNDDARDLAQFMFENPEYKVLFDASRKVKREDIEFVRQMIDRMRGSN